MDERGSGGGIVTEDGNEERMLEGREAGGG